MIWPKGFDEFYAAQWGTRWPSLREKLLEPAAKATLPSPFVGVASEYQLDPASVLVARELRFQPGDSLLDLCAAPGGKSLVTIFDSLGDGRWFLNDVSDARLQRLKAVMREHLDPDVLRKIHFSKRDGSLWGRKQPGSQHKILVDAPCTGERHLIENSRELAQWSPARGRRHQVRQAALLISAIDAARSGGLIVYSTCSLSRVENESVIERALGKRPGLAVEEPLRDSAFEAAARGGYVLPDRMNGCGPMYAAVLRRVTSNPSETS